MNVDHAPPALLRVRTTSSGPADVCVAVAGELDTGNVGWLRAAIIDVLDRFRPATLTLDLGGLRFIGVAGVRVLYELHEAAAAEGCTLTADPLHEAVCLTLARLGLEPEFARPVARGPERRCRSAAGRGTRGRVTARRRRPDRPAR
ncbi:STAS domain-containing protein [Actinoplanes nipponensis]|uniref:STAS domain-containing protein n=1 Tax=Actinoplanes nipponensis TaxID=135950 RepID=UPI0031EE799F